jgi:ADP-ribose pyrophosphatase
MHPEVKMADNINNVNMSDEKLIERTVSSELLFDGKVVHLYFDNITLPDGKPATREYCRHIGAVCVIPITDNGEVICVRQYRYPFAEVLLEIPAGKLDFKGEPHLDAVKRELREETGAVSGKLTYLGKFYTSPAILDETIHMYMAEELSFGDTDFDEDEFIEVVRIPLDEMVQMVMGGEIPDVKTQTAVLKAAHILANRKK